MPAIVFSRLPTSLSPRKWARWSHIDARPHSLGMTPLAHGPLDTFFVNDKFDDEGIQTR